MVVSQRGVGFIYMGCCLFVCFCILYFSLLFSFLGERKKKEEKKKETNLNGIKVLFQFQHCLV